MRLAVPFLSIYYDFCFYLGLGYYYLLHPLVSSGIFQYPLVSSGVLWYLFTTSDIASSNFFYLPLPQQQTLRWTTVPPFYSSFCLFICFHFKNCKTFFHFFTLPISISIKRKQTEKKGPSSHTYTHTTTHRQMQMHQAELMGRYMGHYCMSPYQYTGCKRPRDDDSGIDGPSVKVSCPEGTSSCSCWDYTSSADAKGISSNSNSHSNDNNNTNMGPKMGPIPTPVGGNTITTTASTSWSSSRSATVSCAASGNGTPQYQYLLDDCSCEIEDYMYQGYATEAAGCQSTSTSTSTLVGQRYVPTGINDMYQSQQALSNIEPVQYSLYDVIDE